MKNPISGGTFTSLSVHVYAQGCLLVMIVFAVRPPPPDQGVQHFTTCQRNCRKVMFSVVSVCQLFCAQDEGLGMSYVTITHDALDLTLQGHLPPHLWSQPSSNMGPQCTGTPPAPTWDPTIQGHLPLKHVQTHTVGKQGAHILLECFHFLWTFDFLLILGSAKQKLLLTNGKMLLNCFNAKDTHKANLWILLQNGTQSFISFFFTSHCIYFCASLKINFNHI